MILRNVDFGPVCGASGVQGFFGEGYPWHAVGLNSVGLPNEGAAYYFHEQENAWPDRTEPFMISFMSVEETIEERMEEFNYFVMMFKMQLPTFRARVALQINVTVRTRTWTSANFVERSPRCWTWFKSWGFRS